METEKSKTSSSEENNDEFRVHVASKKKIIEQMNKYKEILKTALDGQPEVTEETKTGLIQELLMNFEAAVQANVLVNGQPWEEVPDVEEMDALDLESLLDDTIVETTRKRRVYPRQILPHVVHTLKAERKILGLYEQAVKPQMVFKDPDQEKIMKDVSAASPVMLKETVQVLKSISTLQQQAEGLCEILHMKPSQASLEIHREVLGFIGQSDAPIRNQQPISEAVEDTAATECYVPPTKKPAPPVGPE